MRSSTSTRRYATRPSPPESCRRTTAAISCTPATPGMTRWGRLSTWLFSGNRGFAQVVVEPAHGSVENVTLVLRLSEGVAFTWIDHQLRLDAQRLERVPELI